MAQASSEPERLDGDALMTLLSDDLLAEIFHRLPTLADIGRAATACAAFRRVVADRAFLRRLRSTHPAPLLGLLYSSTFQPAEAPHGSAPCARALARAADFTFSFVDPSFRGVPVDARDGRVLMKEFRRKGHDALVVCDPLFRRHQLLPAIPRDKKLMTHPRHCLEARLVPSSPDEAGTTSFRVVCVCVECRPPERLVAFVFSSTTGQWTSSAMDPSVRPTSLMSEPCYAYGRFYWRLCHDRNRLLVLDTGSMELSTADVLSGSGHRDGRDFVIVEAGEGRIGMYALNRGGIIHVPPGVYNRNRFAMEIAKAPCYLSYAVREIGDDGKSKWQPEKSVATLLPGYQHSFVAGGASDRCLLLHRVPDSQFLSLEFETTQLKRVCGSYHRGYAKPYTGYPPSLCLPSVE